MLERILWSSRWPSGVGALVLSALSVVSWWYHTQPNAEEYYLALAVMFAIFALAATLIMWGINFARTALVPVAAALGWILFLAVAPTNLLGWPIPVLLAACIGGVVAIAVVLILLERRMAPESRLVLSRRLLTALEWLFPAAVLALVVEAVMSWWGSTDGQHSLWIWGCSIGALLVAVFAWTRDPEWGSASTFALMLTTVAAAAWILFLFVMGIDPFLSDPVWAAVFVGVPMGTMAVLILIARRRSVTRFVFVPRPQLWTILVFNLVAYSLLWGALTADDLASACVLGGVALIFANVAGMPYQAKPDADDGMFAIIAVIASIIVGMFVVYTYGWPPLLALVIALGIRVAVFTLGELIPPRKTSP